MLITHTFFDVETELAETPEGTFLVKILSVDGRRFTYHVHAPLTDDVVSFIKDCLDRVYFSDLIIERSETGWTCRESPTRLKKHG
jgi:hypothetical protein